METQKTLYHPEIIGWGIDANPANEPTWPIKNYTGDDHKRINWKRPFLQKSKVEVLHSNERPGKSAVYGTTFPPSGLSGWIRRRAFRHSEDRFRHWLPLLFADRINVIEGVLYDIFHGHIPNLVGERGWGALWKYRPWLLVRKIAVRLVVFGGIAAGIIYLARR